MCSGPRKCYLFLQEVTEKNCHHLKKYNFNLSSTYGALSIGLYQLRTFSGRGAVGRGQKSVREVLSAGHCQR